MAQPEVTIDQGTLRGCTGTNRRGEPIFKFKGIPYGKPPIGPLRFKAPQPAEKWSGVLDATKEGNGCYSRDLMVKRDEVEGSEDCLFLNVYTKTLPDATNKSLKPVMFWIHGGGFIMGSGSEDLYGPSFLLTEDIVLVTINYRLGIFGLLHFEDASIGVPGNASFKDMVLALTWVQNNIANFNGDPSNVTIFGESAGGGSVALLLMSPLSKGLFHKAIAQSGCAVNPWVLGTRGVGRLAANLGIEHDELAIYKFLMERTTEELLEIQDKDRDLIVPSNHRPLGAVVENQGDGAFIDTEPMEFIKTKQLHDVPIIFGFTSSEGIVMELVKFALDGGPTIEELIPWNLGCQSGTPESREVAKKIQNFYFGGKDPSSEQNITKLYDITSDSLFIYGIYETVVNQFKAIKSPIYLYYMTIDTELNFFKKLFNITAPGVAHADDIGYLFSHFATPQIDPGSIEDKSIDRFVRLWTNFAKFGNPTPDGTDPLLNIVWKPVTGENLDFLEIGQELLLSDRPLSERIQFWKEIYAASAQL